ncbi:MAG: hypothetical protein QGG40_06420, partial [Myxococcota bacterium]|nr:hypothetical protein [Myxococcota bacterium]
MAPISDPGLHTLTLAWMGLAVLVWVLLWFISAPYGRHNRAGWGPGISARLGWILMETPSLLIMAAMFLTAGRFDEPVGWVFVGLWCGHYLNRSFVH